MSHDLQACSLQNWDFVPQLSSYYPKWLKIGDLRGGKKVAMVFRKIRGITDPTRPTCLPQGSWLLDGLKEMNKKQCPASSEWLFWGALLVTFLGVVGDLHLNHQKVTWKKMVDGSWLRWLLSHNLRTHATQRKRCTNGRLKKWTKTLFEVIKLGQTRHSAQGVVDNSFRSFHVWRKSTFTPWIFGG